MPSNSEITHGSQQVRRAATRGHAQHGWLESWHSFSFAGYHDPQRMGWGNLRVINEDRIAPGMGFGMHGHRDMEILSYVLDGELSHTDSLGTVSLIPPGDIQRMSAGTGVRHSEHNHAQGQLTHFLQIWIEPAQLGIEPGYQQQCIARDAIRGRLGVIASPHAAEQGVRINADAIVYAGQFNGTEHDTLQLGAHRKGWVQVLRGTLCTNGELLHAGDALATEGVTQLRFEQGNGAEVLVFDLMA